MLSVRFGVWESQNAICMMTGRISPTNKNHVHQDRPRFRLRACSPWRGFSLDSTLSTVQVILVAAASTLEMAWLGIRVGVARKKYGIQVSRKGVCGPGKCSASFKR
jgi:hypothetical protein